MKCLLWLIVLIVGTDIHGRYGKYLMVKYLSEYWIQIHDILINIHEYKFILKPTVFSYFYLWLWQPMNSKQAFLLPCQGCCVFGSACLFDCQRNCRNTALLSFITSRERVASAMTKPIQSWSGSENARQVFCAAFLTNRISEKQATNWEKVLKSEAPTL